MSGDDRLRLCGGAGAAVGVADEVGAPRRITVQDRSARWAATTQMACPDEANKFFTFLAYAAASQHRLRLDPQIMFGIGGEHDLSERGAAAPGRLARQPPGPGRQRRLRQADRARIGSVTSRPPEDRE